MVSMIAVRDLLSLQGQMDSATISRQLNASPALIEAMLERMEAMGKVARVLATTQACVSGSCRGCPEGSQCRPQQWTLLN